MPGADLILFITIRIIKILRIAVYSKLCMFEAAYKKHYKIIDYWDYLLSLQGII